MSYTTDILITTGSLDENRIDIFNGALQLAGFVPSGQTPSLRTLHRERDELPGAKYYTDGIWAACWNYGSTAVLVATFKSFEWEQPENAVLLIGEEGRDTVVHRPEHC